MLLENLNSKLITGTNILAKGALGGVSRILGILPTSMSLDGVNILVDFKVSNTIEYDMLLGIDCLESFKLEIKFGNGTWRIGVGPYRKFDWDSRKASMFAECAGIVELTVGEDTQLKELLDELLSPGETKLGCAKGVVHEIKLIPGTEPVKQHSRR